MPTPLVIYDNALSEPHKLVTDILEKKEIEFHQVNLKEISTDYILSQNINLLVCIVTVDSEKCRQFLTQLKQNEEISGDFKRPVIVVTNDTSWVTEQQFRLAQVNFFYIWTEQKEKLEKLITQLSQLISI